MLRADLKAAGVPWRDDRGETLDFYTLWHTAGTRLARIAPSDKDSIFLPPSSQPPRES